jgi:hypothetical protein
MWVAFKTRHIAPKSGAENDVEIIWTENDARCGSCYLYEHGAIVGGFHSSLTKAANRCDQQVLISKK